MHSFSRILQYIVDNDDKEVLKAYYDKCDENLKELNGKSIWVSRFIVVLMGLFLVPNGIKDIKIFYVEFDVRLFHLWTPTLLSYFVFEWLLLAKRRRDLILALQQCTYVIYGIVPSPKEKFFPRFDPNSLNVMPFSLMNEAVSIGQRTKFNVILVRISILCIFIFLIGIIGFSLYESICAYHLRMKFHWPTNIKEALVDLNVYVSVILCVVFWLWIGFHYYTDVKSLKKLLAEGKRLQAEQGQND